MSADPAVTVILPSLNVGRYIEACLESVVAQTLKEIEIICVDAGSTDGTQAVISDFARRDARIRVVPSERKSYGRQLNLGLAAARGKYFCIVETDDVVLPGMCKRLYDVAEANALDVLKSDYFLFWGGVYEGNRELRRCAAVPELYGRVVDPLADRRAFSFSINCAGLYSVRFVQSSGIRFNETPGASHQDIGFFYQVHCHARRMAFLAEPFYLYRQDNPDSSVHDRGKVFACCDEYAFLRSRLRQDAALYDKVKSVVGRGMYLAYMSALKRIAPEAREAFADRFAQDLRQAVAAGEIERADFPVQSWEGVQKLLSSPRAFVADLFADETVAPSADGRPLADRPRAVDVATVPVSDGCEPIRLPPDEIAVSVIVPVCNAESYLRECLDSALRQTLRNIEVICVDDGSTDGSLRILRDYARRDDRLRVIVQENAGGSCARNRALDCARGEFVAFLDADDLYPSRETLEQLYASAKRARVNVVGGALERFSAVRPGEITRPNVFPFLRLGVNTYRDAPFDFYYQCFLFGRRMIVGGAICFPPVSRYQDPPFMVQAMEAAKTFCLLKTPAYRYRHGHQNVDWTANDYRKLRDTLVAMRQTVEFAVAKNLDGVVRSTRRRLIDGFAADIVKASPESTAFPEYKRLLIAFPADDRVAIAEAVDRALKDALFLGDGAEVRLRRFAADVGSLELVKRMAGIWSCDWGALVRWLDQRSAVPRIRPTAVRRIGVLYRHLTVGGVQRVIIMLAPILQALGHDVVFILEKELDGSCYPLPENVSVRYLPQTDERDAASIGARVQALRDVIEGERIDLLYDHEYISNLLLWDVLTAKLVCRIPVVLHYHNCIGIGLSVDSATPEFSVLAAKARLCDSVIALSRTDALFLSVQDVNAHYLLNPIDPALRRAIAEARPSRFAAKTVLWCGRLNSEKKPFDALSVFQAVHARDSAVRFVMVGGGSQATENALRRQIVERGLQDCVEMAGVQADVYPYYERASLFLMTSGFEGFALTLLEAGCFGLPTVMYDLPFLETVRGNDGIVSVPQDDVQRAASEICGLLSDEATYDRMARANRDFMARLIDYDHAKAIKNILDDLQNRRPPCAAGTGTGDEAEIRLLLEEIQYFYSVRFRKFKETIATLRAMTGADSSVKSPQQMAQELSRAQMEVARLKRSESYRVGLALTWPFRKLYRAGKWLLNPCQRMAKAEP